QGAGLPATSPTSCDGRTRRPRQHGRLARSHTGRAPVRGRRPRPGRLRELGHGSPPTTLRNQPGRGGLGGAAWEAQAPPEKSAWEGERNVWGGGGVGFGTWIGGVGL